MFSPRKHAYTYKRPPPARPPPIFPSAAPKGPFTPGSSPVRTPQFQSSASTSSSASRPSSPHRTHPVRDIFGDAAFATYRAGLGFPPVSPTAPLFNPAPATVGTPASPISPLKSGRLRPAFDLPPGEFAKIRAERARASARVADLFRGVRRPGRSASWLSREERKQSRLRGDSLQGQKRREEQRRKAQDDEHKKRVQEEQARKLAEEMRVRSELDAKRAEEEKRKKADNTPWATYVAHWEHIMNLPADLPEHELLTARNLPGPLVIPGSVTPDMSVITKERIEAFLMDPAHSEGKSRRERVRAALLIWHPDKCEKWIRKFREDRRPMIREVVGVIACHLTEIMAA